MTHRNVELLIGRLATDPELRRRFAACPATILQEFRQLGFELTPIEVEALGALDAGAIGVFAQSLDRRIRKPVLERKAESEGD
jgi:hypothetical protein